MIYSSKKPPPNYSDLNNPFNPLKLKQNEDKFKNNLILIDKDIKESVDNIKNQIYIINKKKNLFYQSSFNNKTSSANLIKSLKF